MKLALILSFATMITLQLSADVGENFVVRPNGVPIRFSLTCKNSPDLNNPLKYEISVQNFSDKNQILYNLYSRNLKSGIVRGGSRNAQIVSFENFCLDENNYPTEGVFLSFRKSDKAMVFSSKVESITLNPIFDAEGSPQTGSSI